MKPIDYRIVQTGLVCITAIEIYALSKGINGVILTGVIAIIAGVMGISMPTEKFIKNS